MKDDETSGANSMVGYLNNLEVCKYIRVKLCITRSIFSTELAKMVM